MTNDAEKDDVAIPFFSSTTQVAFPAGEGERDGATDEPQRTDRRPSVPSAACQGLLATIRGAEDAIRAHVASRDDDLGALARVALARTNDCRPARADLQVLGVSQGRHSVGSSQAFHDSLHSGGSDQPSERLADLLAEYEDDLTDAAESEDDPQASVAYAVLAALARGERPPETAAKRVVERARDDDR